MKRIQKSGFAGKAIRLLRSVSGMRIPLYAASAGFFIVLSTFPALVLLLALLRQTGLQIEDLLEVLGSFFPEALAANAEDMIIDAYTGLSGTMVGMSAVTALWSASRGIYGLLTGLNAIYGIRETRGYFHTRFISVAYTFAFLLVLLLTLVVHVFGNTLLEFLASRPGSFAAFLVRTVDLQAAALLTVESVIFSLMFMVLPNHRVSFGASWPGAVLAALGWLIFSDLYSVYVDHFAPLSSVYGSVYAVALSMLWLYCCISILFYGGALNCYLKKREQHG